MATTVGTLLVKLKANFGDFKRQMAGVNRTLKDNSQGFKAIGAAATASAVAIGVAMGKALGASVRFEKGMAKLGAVSNTTGTKDFKTLEASALQLASATQYTANEVVEGMNFMAMAGNDTKKILSGMPSVLQLAAASSMDLGRASDIVTNIMSGFGHSAKQLAKDNDVLVRAITGANVDVGMLGESFKYVGPVARSAGVSFEEVTSAIAMLGNVGIQGSMAGTTLRAAITKLLAPTQQGAAEMAKLGLKATDSEGRLLGFDQIVRQLEPHANDTAAMMKIFGLRAGPGMAALVSLGADKLQAFTERLKTSGITAQGVADAQMASLWGQLKVVGSQFERLQIEIASQLVPALTSFAKKLQGVLDWFIALSPTTKKWIAYLIAAAGALSALVAGVAAVAVVLPSMLAGLAAIKGALLAIYGLVGAMSSVALPLIAIAASVALIGKSFYELKKAGSSFTETIALAFGTSENVVRQFYTDVADTIRWLPREIGASLDIAVAWWKESFTTISDWLTEWWNEQTTELNDKLTLWGSRVWGFLPEAWRKALNIVKGYLGSFGTAVAESFDSIFTAIGGKLTKWVSMVKGLFSGIGEMLGTAKEFWFGAEKKKKKKEKEKEKEKDKENDEIEKAKRLLKKLIASLNNTSKDVGGLGTASKDAKNKIADGKDKPGQTGGTSASVDQQALSAQLAAPAMPDVQFGSLDNAAERIARDAEASATAVSDAMLGVGSMVANAFIGAGENMSATMQGAVEGMKTGGPWGAVIGAILALLQKTKSFGDIVRSTEANFGIVVEMLDKFLAAFKPLFAMLDQGVREALTFSAFAGTFSKTMEVVGKVLCKVVSITNTVIDAISKAWNWIVEGVAKFAEVFRLEKLAKKIRDLKVELRDVSSAIAEPVQMEVGPQMFTLAEGFGRLADASANLNDELLNAPEGFKVALRRFESTDGDTIGAEAAGGVNIEQLNVDTTNPTGFVEVVKSLFDEENFAQTGTPLQSSTPMAVDNLGA